MTTRADWKESGFAEHVSTLKLFDTLAKEIDPRLVFMPRRTKTRYYAVMGIGRRQLVEKLESDDQPIRLEPKGPHAPKERKYFKVSAHVQNTLVWVEKTKKAGFEILPSDMHPEHVRFRRLMLCEIPRHRKFLKDLLRASYGRWEGRRRKLRGKPATA